MSDMYQWIDIVSEGERESFKPGETVTISKDYGGGVGQFVEYSPDRGTCTVNVKGSSQEYSPQSLTAAIKNGDDIYRGNTEAQRYGEVDGGDHYLPTLPELIAGTLVRIENIYGAGNGEGYGVFVAYATDGQSAVCNVDSRDTSFPIEYITAAPEETLDKFNDTGTDGALSPMSRGEDNRLDIEIEDESEESKMEDLEKWMKVVEDGPDTEVEEVNEADGDCDCGKYDCDTCFPSDDKVDENVAILAQNEIFDAVYDLAEDCDDDDLEEGCDDDDDSEEELEEGTPDPLKRGSWGRTSADRNHAKHKQEHEKKHGPGSYPPKKKDTKAVDEAQFSASSAQAIRASEMAENYMALEADDPARTSIMRHVDMQTPIFQKAFHKRVGEKDAWNKRMADKGFEGFGIDRLRELAGMSDGEDSPFTEIDLSEEDTTNLSMATEIMQKAWAYAEELMGSHYYGDVEINAEELAAIMDKNGMDAAREVYRDKIGIADANGGEPDYQIYEIFDEIFDDVVGDQPNMMGEDGEEDEEFDTGDSSSEFTTSDDEMVDIGNDEIGYPDDDRGEFGNFTDNQPDSDLIDEPAGGVPEDVNELIHKIAYMQDLGISNSPTHYDVDRLWSMDAALVKRIHAKVTGGPRGMGEASHKNFPKPSKHDFSVDDDAYLDKVSDKDYKKSGRNSGISHRPSKAPAPKPNIRKEGINEAADPEVLRVMKALFE